MLPVEPYEHKLTKQRYTQELKERFLELFSGQSEHPEFGGCKQLCLNAIGVAEITHQKHTQSDPNYKAAYKEAHRTFIEQNMFIPALKRARDGVEKPIIGGKFRDEIVAKERVYSDALMLAMLRAHDRKFRDKDFEEDESNQSKGGVVVLPSAPDTMDKWESTFSELAKGKSGRDAI